VPAGKKRLCEGRKRRIVKSQFTLSSREGEGGVDFCRPFDPFGGFFSKKRAKGHISGFGAGRGRGKGGKKVEADPSVNHRYRKPRTSSREGKSIKKEGGGRKGHPPHVG